MNIFFSVFILYFYTDKVRKKRYKKNYFPKIFFKIIKKTSQIPAIVPAVVGISKSAIKLIFLLRF
ncbi:MAG: hypothetical protein EAZ20_01740 [Bacteroidetes bacterium]|nr:MAG: hypothetical protein EAZ20_01740 [Bacteroidota bacterium]